MLQEQLRFLATFLKNALRAGRPRPDPLALDTYALLTFFALCSLFRAVF